MRNALTLTMATAGFAFLGVALLDWLAYTRFAFSALLQ